MMVDQQEIVCLWRNNTTVWFEEYGGCGIDIFRRAADGQFGFASFFF